MPKCGVMVCGPDAVVQAQPARSFTWGQTETPRVFQYRHLGVIITPDGRQDTHMKQVITQGTARVLQMERLLRDKHLSVRVKRMLVLTALRPLLEYGAEVLVPPREHYRALEGVEFKAARVILRCARLGHLQMSPVLTWGRTSKALPEMLRSLSGSIGYMAFRLTGLRESCMIVDYPPQPRPVTGSTAHPMTREAVSPWHNALYDVST